MDDWIFLADLEKGNLKKIKKWMKKGIDINKKLLGYHSTPPDLIRNSTIG